MVDDVAWGGPLRSPASPFISLISRKRAITTMTIASTTSRVPFHLAAIKEKVHTLIPCGRPSRPSLPLHTALAPTDKLAFYLTPMLRLIPIGNPLWSPSYEPNQLAHSFVSRVD